MGPSRGLPPSQHVQLPSAERECSDGSSTASFCDLYAIHPSIRLQPVEQPRSWHGLHLHSLCVPTTATLLYGSWIWSPFSSRLSLCTGRRTCSPVALAENFHCHVRFSILQRFYNMFKSSSLCENAFHAFDATNTTRPCLS